MAIKQKKLNVCSTNRIMMFFLAFSEREEFLKLNNSLGEYLIFGNFKSYTIIFFSCEAKTHILVSFKYNY
jgi:hypothetical protein